MREVKPQTVTRRVGTSRPRKVGNDHQHTPPTVCGGLYSYRATQRQLYEQDLVSQGHLTAPSVGKLESQSVTFIARYMADEISTVGFEESHSSPDLSLAKGHSHNILPSPGWIHFAVKGIKINNMEQ